MNLWKLGFPFMFLIAMHCNLVTKYVMYKAWKRLPRRRWWVRPVNRPRVARGFYDNLVNELLTEDHEEFFELFRMWPQQFELLVVLVHPYLKKNSLRTPLPTKLRVAVTLLFLAQGSTAKLNHVGFRIGRSTPQSSNDGGVWANTDLAYDQENNAMNLPDAEPLSGLNMPFPYVFVGDEAFPLTRYMMRPYPRRDLTDEKRIYNYRLSRARRTIENAFGILCARWQILQKPVSMPSANLESTFQALVCLHNFLMMAEEMKNPVDRMYAPPDFVDSEQDNGTGRWRNTAAPYITALGRIGGNRSNHLAMGLREYLQHYFDSPAGYEQCPFKLKLRYEVST
ncbi:LOW QUALITY PROTEIN: Protein ALP1-like [Frankliniella fusca]|uniref:Protein ALP1-like n=1 Tax=Frankliniella fusca TaxID=407009 RepID=A0AAE1LJ02_9NEOP|nr:LOW QUALITY PROTEIN: Protein ALP1-like [Frankliniella fusca]